MPRYDLAGNPLPEDAPGARADPAGNSLPGGSLPGAPGASQTDLSGNPLPASSLPPVGGQPSYGQMPPYGQPAPKPLGPGQAPSGRPSPRAMTNEKEKKSLVTPIIAGVVAFLVIGYLVNMILPHHTALPSGYTPFTAKDKSFSCDAPNGWSTFLPADIPASGGDASPGPTEESPVGGVLFKSGNAKIDIITDRVSSLTANALMKEGDPMAAVTMDRADMLMKLAKKRASGLSGYSEQSTSNFDGAFGESRITEYTANGGAFGGGALHGYVIATVGVDRTAQIVCQCREDDFDTLKPAFQHVVNSLKEGHI